MRRGVTKLLFILLFAAFTLNAGCAGPCGTELSRRLIVEAIGIDRADGVYTVTLQALDAYHAGDGEAKDGEGKPTRICTFTGGSVAEALSRVPAATGLTPLYTQARLLLIGRTLYEEGIADALDFFLREYQARSDVLIAAAENDAAEIVEADLGTAAPDAQILEEAILNGQQRGTCCAMKLYRFMNLLYSPSDTAYCPVVGLADAPEEGRKEPVLGTTAFYEDGRLVFTADETHTKGLLFLTGGIRRASISVKGEYGAYTMETARVKTQVRFHYGANGDCGATVTVKAAADVTEYMTGGFGELGEAAALDAQAAGKRYLETLLNDSLSFYYAGHGADVCRLMRRVGLWRPKEKTAFCENLVSQKAGTVAVETEFTVRRTGKESLGR